MAFDLEEAVSYYHKQGAPADQSAVISLLREVQQEFGSIPTSLLPSLAQKLGTKESYFLALIRRIPSLRLSDRHCLELCAGPNCGKHAALGAFAESLCRASGGKITLRYLPCQRQCGKGPNIRWDGTLYNHADEALLKKLAENIN